MPPSALPRPPRSLKPPRKLDYDRLSDTELKHCSQTPPPTPKLLQIPTSSTYDLKSSSLSRNSEFGGRQEYSPSPSSGGAGGGGYIEMKESLSFPKPDFSLKRKDYGSMTNTSEFSKPEYTSTRNYQRLEGSPKPTKQSEAPSMFKRSLLPSVRKYSSPQSNTTNITNTNGSKNSRDSLNSSGSNNSTNSQTTRSSPVHIKTDSTTFQSRSRTPPKYMQLSPQEKSFLDARQQQRQQQQQQLLHPSSAATASNKTSMIPGCSPTNVSALPPKPNMDGSKSITRRGSSLTRGENRYRIQF